MAQCPDAVTAEPRLSNVPLPPRRPARPPAPVAKAVVAPVTPSQVTSRQATPRQAPVTPSPATPSPVTPAAKSAAGPVAAATPVHDPEAHGEAFGNVMPDRPSDEPTPAVQKPRAAGGCNGGKRVVSTYYWEGSHTASGQPFNPNGLTAAHRTLPFGTRLTVSNPRNGKSVIVVINDRGPFVSGVVLDLSLGAAKAIGMNGTGPVCIQ
jgi:rare lipoprotein A